MHVSLFLRHTSHGCEPVQRIFCLENALISHCHRRCDGPSGSYRLHWSQARVTRALLILGRGRFLRGDSGDVATSPAPRLSEAIVVDDWWWKVPKFSEAVVQAPSRNGKGVNISGPRRPTNPPHRQGHPSLVFSEPKPHMRCLGTDSGRMFVIVSKLKRRPTLTTP